MWSKIESLSRKVLSHPNRRGCQFALDTHMGLSIENLEDRRLLAGNVTVEVDNGDLEIDGNNNQDNGVVIEATDQAGSYVVRGINGTTINDSSDPVTVNGVTGDFGINLRSGDNLLLLTEAGQEKLVVPQDLDIDVRGGDDVLVLDNVEVGGETDMRTRSGDDVILVVDGSFSDDVSVNMGGDRDVFVANSFAEFNGEMDVRMGGGEDALITGLAEFNGTADLRMGGGNDRMGFFRTTFVDEVDLRGNGGVDEIAEFENTYLDNDVSQTSIENIFDDGPTIMAGQVGQDYAGVSVATGLLFNG